jgi:hypothetical protein
MQDESGKTETQRHNTNSPAPQRAFDQDFLRGDEEIVDQLTKTLARAPDVGQAYPDQSWDTITRLAWRPAWSIRSRRGALKPLIDWWRKKSAR